MVIVEGGAIEAIAEHRPTLLGPLAHSKRIERGPVVMLLRDYLVDLFYIENAGRGRSTAHDPTTI